MAKKKNKKEEISLEEPIIEEKDIVKKHILKKSDKEASFNEVYKCDDLVIYEILNLGLFVKIGHSGTFIPRAKVENGKVVDI